MTNRIKQQMIINRGNVSVCVCVCVCVVKKPVQLCAPNLKLLGKRRKKKEEGGLQYCNVPGGKINGQLIDVSVGVRL